MHMGDYLYEYGPSTYPSPEEAVRYDAFPGGLQPPYEMLSLDDYRARYKTYRSDPGLQVRDCLSVCCVKDVQIVLLAQSYLCRLHASCPGTTFAHHDSSSSRPALLDAYTHWRPHNLHGKVAVRVSTAQVLHEFRPLECTKFSASCAGAACFRTADLDLGRPRAHQRPLEERRREPQRRRPQGRCARTRSLYVLVLAHCSNLGACTCLSAPPQELNTARVTALAHKMEPNYSPFSNLCTAGLYDVADTIVPLPWQLSASLLSLTVLVLQARGRLARSAPRVCTTSTCPFAAARTARLTTLARKSGARLTWATSQRWLLWRCA